MVVLQSLGADVVGINCSTGPERMADMVRQMKPYANVPILAKPNAGLPQMVDGETVYDMGPEEFASFGPMLMEAGAAVLGAPLISDFCLISLSDLLTPWEKSKNASTAHLRLIFAFACTILPALSATIICRRPATLC